MKKLNLIIILATSLVLGSCNIKMSLGEVGNGNLTTEDRTISEDFNQIKSSSGMEVYLTQGEENKVVVEIDENLQEFVEIKVLNGSLKIGASENIKSAKAKKVYVTYTELDNIEASSGSEVKANSVIKSQNLSLKASSGAEIDLEVFSQDLIARASSGAEIDISGKATSITAQASSGAEIDAKDLLVINCNAKASSGAEISVNVKENIDAKASSGGDIKYYGHPTKITSNKSSAGRVKKAS